MRGFFVIVNMKLMKKKAFEQCLIELWTLCDGVVPFFFRFVLS